MLYQLACESNFDRFCTAANGLTDDQLRQLYCDLQDIMAETYREDPTSDRLAQLEDMGNYVLDRLATLNPQL